MAHTLGGAPSRATIIIAIAVNRITQPTQPQLLATFVPAQNHASLLAQGIYFNEALIDRIAARIGEAN